MNKELFKIARRYFDGLRKEYPFSKMIECYSVPCFSVIAVNRAVIEITRASELDFLGEYSRKILVIMKDDYHEQGCIVFGGNWLDLHDIKERDIHFYRDSYIPGIGYRLCVGVPESFWTMENVLIENVRTAENMLIAYERLLSQESGNLLLNAYPHGNLGRNQYRGEHRNV